MAISLNDGVNIRAGVFALAGAREKGEKERKLGFAIGFRERNACCSRVPALFANARAQTVSDLETHYRDTLRTPTH